MYRWGVNAGGASPRPTVWNISAHPVVFGVYRRADVESAPTGCIPFNNPTTGGGTHRSRPTRAIQNPVPAGLLGLWPSHRNNAKHGLRALPHFFQPTASNQNKQTTPKFKSFTRFFFKKSWGPGAKPRSPVATGENPAGRSQRSTRPPQRANSSLPHHPSEQRNLAGVGHVAETHRRRGGFQCGFWRPWDRRRNSSIEIKRCPCALDNVPGGGFAQAGHRYEGQAAVCRPES